MTTDQQLMFVASGFSGCVHSSFTPVHTITTLRPTFRCANRRLFCPRSPIVRMVDDTASAMSSKNNGEDGDAISDSSDVGDPIQTEDIGGNDASSPMDSVLDTAEDSSDATTNEQRSGIVQGIIGEGVIEDVDQSKSSNEEREEESIDIEKLMIFDGLNPEKDENGEYIVEELEPHRMWRNHQKMRENREKFKVHETDTGSPEYQIASLTSRIAYMTEHLRENPKDFASTRGLLRMVSRRTKLLRYLKRTDESRFHNIISGLNIRISQQLRRL